MEKSVAGWIDDIGSKYSGFTEGLQYSGDSSRRYS